MTEHAPTYSAFAGYERIARGDLPEVARAIMDALESGEDRRIAVFEDATSAPVDLDLRGSAADIEARATEMAAGRARSGAGRAGDTEATPSPSAAEKRGPGRPKLGVVGREVTLLPRQWDWLAAQPGGASVTLRKLVEAARKADQGSGSVRRTQDVTYRFMHALAGDLPDFEEATRALYRWDLDGLQERIGSWPEDVRAHILELVRTGR